jgi:hypothetical protein
MRFIIHMISSMHSSVGTYLLTCDNNVTMETTRPSYCKSYHRFYTEGSNYLAAEKACEHEGEGKVYLRFRRLGEDWRC